MPELIHIVNRWRTNSGLGRGQNLPSAPVTSVFGRAGVVTQNAGDYAVGQVTEKNRECTLYPFIAAWNQRLLEVAAQDFARVREFRQLIIAELRDWIVPKPNYSEAEYYNGFYRLRGELEFPLRIFSLNYDLCLENVSNGKGLETGFDPATSTWDGTRFESRETDAPAIYLYKMHGSINWYRDRNAGNLLKMAASPQQSSSKR